VVARVRTFVLQGYTGADRVAVLLSAEKWPTPTERRYDLKKPKARWNYTTASRIIGQLDFPPETLPNPATYPLGALRRILTFFSRRGVRDGEDHLHAWLLQCETALSTFQGPRPKPKQVAKTHLFDNIT
jgi:uncharacterized protein YbjT (DUF2867 family)